MFCFRKKNDPPKPADPQLLAAVKAFIDEHFEPEVEVLEDAFAGAAPPAYNECKQMPPQAEYTKKKHAKFAKMEQASYSMPAPSAAPAMGNAMPRDLDEFLRKTDAGFSETLLKLIDETGEKDSDVYKRARVDRKLFSKIRSNPDYRPSKTTALAFALALHLDLGETNELIGRAGYVLSHSSRADLIAEYFITNGNYDIDALNEVLFAYDLPLIGGVA
ncbi:MAG: hypothetical protein IK035_05545 [Firmicutes bacterium]|nr:hypothetical protein [Bacillota bacterium]